MRTLCYPGLTLLKLFAGRATLLAALFALSSGCNPNRERDDDRLIAETLLLIYLDSTRLIGSCDERLSGGPELCVNYYGGNRFLFCAQANFRPGACPAAGAIGGCLLANNTELILYSANPVSEAEARATCQANQGVRFDLVYRPRAFRDF